jgi:hypothetical protein
VLYLDAFRLVQGSRELQNDHIWSCVDFLRSRHMYKQASLVYVPENLPGSKGGEVAYLMQHVPNSLTLSEYGAGADRRPGVPKNAISTQNMMLRMKRALFTNSLCFASDFGVHRDATPAAMVQALCDQLLVYRFDERTHKLSGKAEGGRDDLLVAAMMPLYWHEAFKTHPWYDQFVRTQEARKLMPLPAH